MRWAETEFKTIDLGDKRLDNRATVILNSLLDKPGLSIPAACNGWNETIAAYRFFDNSKTTPEKILSPHIESTITRAREHKEILCLQDTSEMDFTSKFKVISQDIQPTINNEDLHVEVDLQITNEDGDPDEYDVEWGAFGFIFVLATLSFADARPRNASSIDYKERDEFSVGDLFDCLKFENGELRFYADYINGRCLKTDIVVRKDGSVTLETTNRGKALLHWLERLKGKGKLKAIK